MRILHVHDRAGFMGGVEQILFDTARGLAESGWPQALLTADTAPASEFLVPFERVFQDLSETAAFRPDVVLMHKVADPQQVREVSRRFPSAHMVHDHDLVCPRRHKYFPFGHAICNLPAGVSCYTHGCFIQRAEADSGIPIRLQGTGLVRRRLAAAGNVRRHIVGSDYMKRELVMNGIPAAGIAVVHPVPASLKQPGVRPAGHEAEFLFVGQVIRGKGVDLMLRALAGLTGEWRATIVGQGHHLDGCRVLASELGIDRQVNFTGWIAHDELETFYTRARAVVVPSRWPEPFGMVGIEAMARGRAVVAFDSGGISDWLDDGVTGLLAPSANVPAMTAALQRLLDDPALAAHLGAAGAEQAARKFSHQAYLANIKSQLEQLQ